VVQEPEGSSPHSQQPATGPYPEPDETLNMDSAITENLMTYRPNDRLVLTVNGITMYLAYRSYAGGKHFGKENAITCKKNKNVEGCIRMFIRETCCEDVKWM
jgi:hypothetical protein